MTSPGLLTNRAELEGLFEEVGARHDMPATWLNDAAAPFWPTGASFDDCDVVFRRPSLVVRTPSPDVIFVMKLYRADPQDREDMVLLWPRCAFDTPEAATRAYTAGYPHAPEDAYLTSYISDIARDSEALD